jgi:glutathione S-transferase
MTELHLIVGDKSLSSWSLRPYVVLKHLGVPFRETIVPLDRPQTRSEIARHSPSGRVPVLRHGALTVWDSLAICEYLNELFPEASLWPREISARAHARAVSAEMHSGFSSLRSQFPMRFGESIPGRVPTAETQGDIARIVALWAELRGRFSSEGPFLFGRFTIADAMFAPVVSRFRTYGIALHGAADEYARTVWQLPAMQTWLRA